MVLVFVVVRLLLLVLVGGGGVGGVGEVVSFLLLFPLSSAKEGTRVKTSIC